jgi:uncharacterized protein YbaA (DUF1428 family)
MELGSMTAVESLASDVAVDEVGDAGVVVGDTSDTAIVNHYNDVEVASVQQAVESEPDAVVVDSLETYMGKNRTSDYDH